MYLFIGALISVQVSPIFVSKRGLACRYRCDWRRRMASSSRLQAGVDKQDWVRGCRADESQWTVGSTGRTAYKGQEDVSEGQLYLLSSMSVFSQINTDFHVFYQGLYSLNPHWKPETVWRPSQIYDIYIYIYIYIPIPIRRRLHSE